MQRLVDTYLKIKHIYEKNYDVHICRKEEIEEVILFINEYWQKDHILTKSRELLNWQHYDKKNERYNFVIAKSRKNNEIHGLIGFIISNIYDEDIISPIRWGAIWKIREDVAPKGLGLYLKGYMEMEIPVEYIGGVGLSKYSKKIDEKLGEHMGKLEQYYVVNPNFKEYVLIDNPELPDMSIVNVNSNKKFTRINEDEFIETAKFLKGYIMPYKSIQYYVNRYYRHPIYHYEFIKVSNGVYVEAVFVYRRCMVERKSNAFIVDYIGQVNAFEGCYNLFVELMKNSNIEHISFPCKGFSKEMMLKAGFLLRDDTQVILPVYYEPFVRCNVELDYHFWTKNSYKDIIIVKGDADQDRPNRL